MIYLALKRTPARSANTLSRFFAWVIKARLVSAYCHSGMVEIDGDKVTLYHSNSHNGLHRIDYLDSDSWELYPTNLSREQLMVRYHQAHPAPYDWLSLLAFVGIKATDSKRMYCFEWCWYAMTGEKPSFRVTPETLLAICRS